MNKYDWYNKKATCRGVRVWRQLGQSHSSVLIQLHSPGNNFNGNICLPGLSNYSFNVLINRSDSKVPAFRLLEFTDLNLMDTSIPETIKIKLAHLLCFCHLEICLLCNFQGYIFFTNQGHGTNIVLHRLLAPSIRKSRMIEAFSKEKS